MSFIIMDVQALDCQAPVFTNSEWTGVRYIFSIDWISNGEEYSIIDPSTNLELSMDIYDNLVTPNVLVYSTILEPSAEFNAVDYQFDVFDYYPTFSSKYTIVLTLKLTSNAACNETSSYTIPIDYP